MKSEQRILEATVRYFTSPHRGPADKFRVLSFIQQNVSVFELVRSRKWRDDIDRLFSHLANREKTRLKKSGVSRFERGDLKILEATRFAARALLPEFRVFIIQPGISKSQVHHDQLELLGMTELYLHETVGIRFVAVGGI